MKNLSSSIVSVCIVAVVLTVFRTDVFRGSVAAEDILQNPETSHAYEELHLALGEVPGEDPNNPPVVRFFLADIGGAFYVVHAVFLPVPTIDDPDYEPVMLTGTGQVVEMQNGSTSNKVFYMNLHYSQEHAESNPYGYNHAGMVGQISLDLSTFEGSYWMVGTEHNPHDDRDDRLFDKFKVFLFGELPESLKVVNTSII
jgi:hypothetical protein